MILRAANQAPRADTGSATKKKMTIAVDGDQKVIEPSTATMPANGSEGPTKPVPISCQP